MLIGSSFVYAQSSTSQPSSNTQNSSGGLSQDSIAKINAKAKPKISPKAETPDQPSMVTDKNCTTCTGHKNPNQ